MVLTVVSEAESAATGKLKGGISNKFEGEICVQRTMSGTADRSPPLEKEVVLEKEAVGIVDKLKRPGRSNKILHRRQDDLLEQFRRS